MVERGCPLTKVGKATLTFPQLLPCEAPAMRLGYILLAAVPLGLAAGYGWSNWSAWSHPAPRAAVPPVVEAKEVDPPETPADKEWDARSDEQVTPPLEQASPDPTAVEQSVYYRSCRDAWAAGKAPIHAGQPGYRTALDGDGDGIACEPIPSRI